MGKRLPMLILASAQFVAGDEDGETIPATAIAAHA